jgi:hypothetical protein
MQRIAHLAQPAKLASTRAPCRRSGSVFYFPCEQPEDKRLFIKEKSEFSSKQFRHRRN